MKIGIRGKIALSAISITLTLVLAEVLVRVADHRSGIGFWGDKGNPLAQNPPRVLPFRTFGFDPYRTVDGEERISDTTRRQFPLQKKAGTFRIVCFGGSTTAQQIGGVDYPRILQKRLRSRAARTDIEVSNAGNASYTAAHSLILLSLNVLSWQPDLIILSHNINDLTALYFPEFRGDYWNKYLAPELSAPDFRDRFTWNNVLFQRSRLYWLLSRAVGTRGFRDLDSRGRSIRRAPYDEALPERGAYVFRRNIESFIALARSRDIPVMLGTQPHESSEEYFVRHMGYKSYNDFVVYPLHEQHLEYHARYNQVIRDVATEFGVGLVDNEKTFNGDRKFFMDHVHYTDEGLYRLARNYAGAVMTDYLSEAN